MKKTITNIINRLFYPYRLLRARIAYDRAVLKAEENLSLTGQRTYVIKGANRTLLLTDRSSFRLMKRKHIIKHDRTIKDIERICLYCTAYVDGKDAMPPEIIKLKRNQAIQWLSKPKTW